QPCGAPNAALRCAYAVPHSDELALWLRDVDSPYGITSFRSAEYSNALHPCQRRSASSLGLFCRTSVCAILAHNGRWRLGWPSPIFYLLSPTQRKRACLKVSSISCSSI